jgi:2-dehydropantoate 2-reductase
MGDTRPEQSSTMGRIGVAGAGAIGLTIAARLAMAGNDVTLVARGDSLRTIRSQGVRLIDLEGDRRVPVNAVPSDRLEIRDVIFLCSKSQDLPSLVTAIRHAISSQTLLVPLVNGIPWWFFEGDVRERKSSFKAVDPTGILEDLLPRRQVLGSVTMITAERLGPGIARSINPIRVTLGALSEDQTGHAVAVAAHMSAAGIATSVVPHIADAVWTKVLLNLCSNPLSVTSGATLGELFGNAQLRDISHRMLEEAMAVAKACGADIRQDAAELLAIGGRMGQVKTSMLQDFERDAPLELASICWAVMELAESHGIDMPTTRAIANLAGYLSEQKQSRARSIATCRDNAATMLPASA